MKISFSRRKPRNSQDTSCADDLSSKTCGVDFLLAHMLNYKSRGIDGCDKIDLKCSEVGFNELILVEGVQTGIWDELDLSYTSVGEDYVKKRYT